MAAVTWNPADKSAAITLSNGDRTATYVSGQNAALVRATLGKSSGAWYFESSFDAGNSQTVGLAASSRPQTTTQLGFATAGNDIAGWGIELFSGNGAKAHNGSGASTGSHTFVAGDVVGVAIDFAAQKIWFAINNTWVGSGNPAAGTNPAYSGSDITGTLYPAHTAANAGSTNTARFKTADFTYTPPTGFSPWDDGAVTGAVSFSGAGSLAPTGNALSPAAAAFAGTGSAAFAPAFAPGAVAFSGSGAMAAAGAMLAKGAVAFAGAGSLDVKSPRVVFVIKFSNRGRLLLYEPLPLRTTRMLGDFAADVILPHRYGDLTSGRFKLERLDDSTFFAADHPMTVDRVFVDDQETPGWAQETRSDGIGNTWTVVVLTAPAPNDARLSATGTGKRNPRTGALIENPADIIEDVLRIAGRTDQWWDQLRAEAAAEGLRLAGSIGEAKSIRAILDEICESAGAIWAPGMARLYPVAARSGYIAKLDKMKVSNIVISANIDNTADVLRASYDPDAAAARAQHYIELTANPSLYGRIVAERSFGWLRTPQNAETVGKRVLPWLAGERYDVAFDCGDDSIRPGTWVQFVDHPEWPFAGEDPEVMVLSALANQGGKTVACIGQTLRTTPAAIVTGHSVALPVTRDAALNLSIADGVQTFIALDRNDRPIVGALISLDKGAPKTTDERGSVSFTASPGEHEIAMQAPGKRAEIMTVTF